MSRGNRFNVNPSLYSYLILISVFIPFYPEHTLIFNIIFIYISFLSSSLSSSSSSDHYLPRSLIFFSYHILSPSHLILFPTYSYHHFDSPYLIIFIVASSYPHSPIPILSNAHRIFVFIILSLSLKSS